MFELKILILGPLELELKPNVCFLCFFFFFFSSFDNEKEKRKKRELSSVVTVPDSLTPVLGKAIGELLNLLLKNSIGPLA